MNLWAMIAAAISALLAGWALFRPIFGDAGEFRDCLRYSFTPDLISMFRGEWLEDIVKSFKLSLYFGLMGMAGYGAYQGVLWIAG